MNELNKKLVCKHCNTTIEKNGKCKCGAIILNENQIIKGEIERDYLDCSPELLCG